MSVLISEEKNINCLVLCCFYSKGQKSAFMEMLKIELNKYLFKTKNQPQGVRNHQKRCATKAIIGLRIIRNLKACVGKLKYFNHFAFYFDTAVNYFDYK